MDGNFQNKSHAYEEIIKSWMLTIIGDGGIARHDDLHIDRIDHAWRPRNLWIPGALHAYNIAIKIRNRNKIGFSVVLAFSLKTSEKPIGIDFHSKEQFEARFNRTPPSLYLFKPGSEPWTQTKAVAQQIPPAIFGGLADGEDCWYLQFKYDDSEGYSRSVFVTG
jgi:hypothetical protein